MESDGKSVEGEKNIIDSEGKKKIINFIYSLIIIIKNTKNSIGKTSLLIFSLVGILGSCSQVEKSNTGSTTTQEIIRVKTEAIIDKQKREENNNIMNEINSINNESKKVIDPKTNMEVTKYSDGRTSEVRTESYYTESIKTLDKNTNLQLFFFVMEYNDYEAVISDKDGVFGQLPSNTMTQIKKNVAGQNFFIFADTIFQKKFNLLKPMTIITDRSIDRVSFDFVTNKGVYTVQESKMNLDKDNSIWSELYKKAKEVKPKN